MLIPMEGNMVNLLAELKNAYGEGAEFREGQQEAI